MAKKKTAKQIVEEAMPNVRVMPPMPTAPLDDAVGSVQQGVSVRELRQKYLGDAMATDETSADEEPQSNIGGTLEIENLRRRFLGDAGATSRKAISDDTEEQESEDDDVEIVRIESSASADDATSGPGVRSVLVSKAKGKIIGKQG
ncbi:MAG: hypothetical protein JWP89_760 [Schlesneria sp.]|nr:hypothetical protein [Schlesneria sp.]